MILTAILLLLAGAGWWRLARGKTAAALYDSWPRGEAHKWGPF